MADEKPVVGIIMGSKSDMPAMEPCMQQLDEFCISYEVKVASAHRKPLEVHEWASTAHERGIKVIIAAAGKAAHLGGVVAAYTPDPVIAVPMKTSDLGGLDSLLSMVQMPSGVPVACVAINGAKNAAILAVQMLGTNCDGCRQKIIDFKAAMAEAASRPARCSVKHKWANCATLCFQIFLCENTSRHYISCGIDVSCATLLAAAARFHVKGRVS